MMTRRRERPLPRFGQPAKVLVWTACAGFLLLGAAFVPATSAAPAWNPEPVSWTNGVVLCQFSASRPSVNVSALDLNGTGLTIGFGGIAELRPNGSIAATADFTNASWAFWNASTEDSYDLAFTAEVTVDSTAPTPARIGVADVRIDFVLPVHAGTAGGSLTTVTVGLSVSNWTWQGMGDSLEVRLPAAPAFPLAEHLAASTAPGWLLTSVSNSSGRSLAWLQPGSNALAQPASGVAVTVSATPTLALQSAASGTVTVVFGPSAGAYRSLTYDTEVGIVLPSTIAGIPLADFVAVGAAAAASSLAIAAVARRIRARPSRLIYSDEEGP